jgi:anthranilate phosphoribosyltransferase
MMRFKRAKQSDLRGGKNVQEAADIFIKIPKNEGTVTQNSVVNANAQMALKCYYPSKSFEECRAIACESLLTGKAYKSFSKLIELQA